MSDQPVIDAQHSKYFFHFNPVATLSLSVSIYPFFKVHRIYRHSLYPIYIFVKTKDDFVHYRDFSQLYLKKKKSLNLNKDQLLPKIGI